MHSFLKKLVGQHLNSVELLPGYFQLVLDSARLSVISTPTLTDEHGSVTPTDSTFADRVWKLVGSDISDVTGNDQTEEVLTFGLRGSMRIPVGASAGMLEPLILIRADGSMVIWE